MLGSNIEFCALEESLGRNASPVQAGTTGTLQFNTGNFPSKLAGTDCRSIARRATPDDNEIILVVCTHLNL
jgi:hypothetical protein